MTPSIGTSLSVTALNCSCALLYGPHSSKSRVALGGMVVASSPAVRSTMGVALARKCRPQPSTERYERTYGKLLNSLGDG